ncbi:MAG: recombination mediator RecR [Verrucomicrobiota bacterium]
MKRADFPQEIQDLISAFKRLPGVGPRSAERIVVWLLNGNNAVAGDLEKSLGRVKSGVARCTVCGFYQPRDSECTLCTDPARDAASLCLVEQPTDVLAIDKTGAFRGHYHCLGGRLAPLENVGPEDLLIDALVARLKQGEVEEIILALGSDVEGEATANYLADLIRTQFANIRVTQLAQGLPAGGGLDHADEVTLFRALDGRRLL